MVVLWAGISTFFVETSVHGFKYIVEDTAALWEKLFWTITLALSLTTAGKPYTQCLKITEKVSFNIASEASYAYILNGQKLIKNTKWISKLSKSILQTNLHKRDSKISHL